MAAPVPSSLSRSSRTNDEIRRANDRHRHWVPVLVVAFLLLVAYLWTDWMSAYPPPGIGAVSQSQILNSGLSEGHLERSVWIHWANEPDDMNSNNQCRVLLLLTAIGFLLMYYLPLKLKRLPLVVLTFIGVAWVINIEAMALFLACHLLSYATFHSPPPRKASTAAGLAVFAFCLWLPSVGASLTNFGELLLIVGLTTPLLFFFYLFIYHPLSKGAAGKWMQAFVAHMCLIYIAIAVLWAWLAGSEFPRVTGLLLFFWQWERLVMYKIDYNDDRVPGNLKLFEYLAAFLSPAILSNYHWLNRIPTGYDYLTNSFLARDKNRVVLSGIWLISLSVFFFCLGPVILTILPTIANSLGIMPLISYEGIVEGMKRGYAPQVAGVWTALIYQFLRFYLLWTAVAHLKVGLWRLFGYDIEPYFNKPFASTNLVELWKRFSYYYRQFLVQAFYYPVFLRFFKKWPKLRIFVATFAAAGFGNLLFHIVDSSLIDGAAPGVVVAELRAYPYYLLLGVAIALTQVWLVARGWNPSHRKAWTWGWKLGLDVLAATSVIGFFILIRPFHHLPKDYPLIDTLRLVFSAFGVSI